VAGDEQKGLFLLLEMRDENDLIFMRINDEVTYI